MSAVRQECWTPNGQSRDVSQLGSVICVVTAKLRILPHEVSKSVRWAWAPMFPQNPTIDHVATHHTLTRRSRFLVMHRTSYYLPRYMLPEAYKAILRYQIIENYIQDMLGFSTKI
jgi:hypothetical protein